MNTFLSENFHYSNCRGGGERGKEKEKRRRNMYDVIIESLRLIVGHVQKCFPSGKLYIIFQCHHIDKHRTYTYFILLCIARENLCHLVTKKWIHVRVWHILIRYKMHMFMYSIKIHNQLVMWLNTDIIINFWKYTSFY